MPHHIQRWLVEELNGASHKLRAPTTHNFKVPSGGDGHLRGLHRSLHQNQTYLSLASLTPGSLMADRQSRSSACTWRRHQSSTSSLKNNATWSTVDSLSRSPQCQASRQAAKHPAVLKRVDYVRLVTELWGTSISNDNEEDQILKNKCELQLRHVGEAGE